MAALIKKLMSAQVFNRRTAIPSNTEVESHTDMDEWKGWDAWVDIKK